MTAPNEPGNGDSADFAGQRAGVRPGVGRATETGETSSGQRGPVAPRPVAPRPPEPAPPKAPPTRQEPPPTAHSTGVDARPHRLVVGTTAAPATPSGQAKPAPGDPNQGRTESQQGDAYGSELPDLSDSRAAQRKSTGQRREVSAQPRGPVRASMQIRRIDPWSALKVSLLLSVALFFVWMLSVAFLYLLLGSMGVWSKLNSNVGDLLTNTSGTGELVSSGSIFGGATLIGLVNIVVLTAMATLGAVIYNLSTDVVGGVEVTLADRD